MSLLSGNKVMYGQYSGTEIKVDGKNYLIMKEADVYGIIES
jgi:chaperonin GroES